MLLIYIVFSFLLVFFKCYLIGFGILQELWFWLPCWANYFINIWEIDGDLIIECWLNAERAIIFSYGELLIDA